MATATEQEVTWQPQPGSQVLFLSCPFYEALYTGTRGPGKTDALLMDFAQHVGQGFGEDWQGILFRQTFPQLRDVIRKANKWFNRIFPEAIYNKSEHVWSWPDGEQLILAYMSRPDDYWNYHGHEYPWIGWEEITNWPTPECYHVMKSCNRSSNPDVPRKYRATCNPYGKGHNWVKSYFIDPAPAGVPFKPDVGEALQVLADYGEGIEGSGKSLKAVTIHGHYRENRALMDAQPNYPAHIAQAASNLQQAKAWLSDDWDIVAGGMFDDVWRRDKHVLPDFIPPDGWRIYRAFDWGSSKPFSVGWWAEANGEQVVLPNGDVFCPPRGSRVRIAEWYGWDGNTPNAGIRMPARDVAKGVRDREKRMGVHGRVDPGPGDFPTPAPGESSMRDIFEGEGVPFTEPNKASGSRVNGWEVMRGMFKEAAKDYPEDPGLWVTERCRQFIRTIPTLPRSDKDPDDIDTEAEDHVADEARYALSATGPGKASSIPFRIA